ncbi:MAG: ferritin-like domain-containing protein [Planctomycetota bacterium]|jgi:rubrerythrin
MAMAGPDEEIFEFAIAREIEANRFYLALAERVNSPEMRKVFQDFAAEELEHKEKLELEVLKTGRVLKETSKTIIPEHDYIKSDSQALLDMDYKDILLLGMEKEEAAFRIYVNLLATIRDQESREVLLGIAEEEVKHKLRFEMEYELLLKKH